MSASKSDFIKYNVDDLMLLSDVSAAIISEDDKSTVGEKFTGLYKILCRHKLNNDGTAPTKLLYNTATAQILYPVEIHFGGGDTRYLLITEEEKWKILKFDFDLWYQELIFQITHENRIAKLNSEKGIFLRGTKQARKVSDEETYLEVIKRENAKEQAEQITQKHNENKNVALQRDPVRAPLPLNVNDDNQAEQQNNPGHMFYRPTDLKSSTVFNLNDTEYGKLSIPPRSPYTSISNVGNDGRERLLKSLSVRRLQKAGSNSHRRNSESDMYHPITPDSIRGQYMDASSEESGGLETKQSTPKSSNSAPQTRKYTYAEMVSGKRATDIARREQLQQLPPTPRQNEDLTRAGRYIRWEKIVSDNNIANTKDANPQNKQVTSSPRPVECPF